MPRRRSNSLPIPKIEVSIYQSPETKKKENGKEFIEIPDTKDTTVVAGKNYLSIEKAILIWLINFKTQIL